MEKEIKTKISELRIIKNKIVPEKQTEENISYEDLEERKTDEIIKKTQENKNEEDKIINWSRN